MLKNEINCGAILKFKIFFFPKNNKLIFKKNTTSTFNKV